MALLASLVGLTLLHLALPANHRWHAVHIGLQLLYYPALVLAAWWGPRASLLTSLTASGLLVWMASSLWADPMVRTEALGEVGTFWLVSALASDLFGRLRRSQRQLEQSHEEALEALAAAVDLRERETGAHCKRVRAYARLVAERLGYPAAEMPALLSGALLHDIGKLGVPDAILLKPGPLTREERTVMQRHPEQGLRLLGGVAFLHHAAEVVGYHHERWDGTGYPFALAGEEIPRAARLFSVVDVFDALTSPRPYRAPMTTLEAREYLRAQAGTQFDAAMVETFCSLPVEQLVAAAQEFGLRLDATSPVNVDAAPVALGNVR